MMPIVQAAPLEIYNKTLYSHSNGKNLIEIELLEQFVNDDLFTLCDATEDALEAGGGFGWISSPGRDELERYWQGLLMISAVKLFVGRIDGVIVGSIQLRTSPKNQEARAHVGQIGSTFVAPWARGHGVARALAKTVEDYAQHVDLKVLELDVRETQTAAISAFEHLGFVRFGENPHYAYVDGQYVRGFYYKKHLTLD